MDEALLGGHESTQEKVQTGFALSGSEWEEPEALRDIRQVEAPLRNRGGVSRCGAGGGGRMGWARLCTRFAVLSRGEARGGGRLAGVGASGGGVARCRGWGGRALE